MTRFAALYFPLFLGALLVWTGLGLYVLLDRIRFDLGRGRRRRALAAVWAVLATGPTGAQADEALRRLVERLPATLRNELLVDPGAPAPLAAAFAGGRVARRGLARLLRDSVVARGGRRKWRRISAMAVLARVGHKRIHGILGRALRDPDPDVAGAAVSLLGQLGDARAAGLLVEALGQEGHPPSRIATQLERFPGTITPLLAPLLQDSRPHLRYWAAAVLGRLGGGPRIAVLLRAACADPDPAVRKAAVQGLGACRGEGATAAARALLVDPVPYVRAHALRALGALGATDAAAGIAEGLADPDWWVRLAAKEALVQLGDGAAAAVEGQLDSEDGFARNGAAEVLQNLGVLDRWLAEALGAPGSEARLRLVRALRAGGGGMVEAVLAEPDPQRRERLRALLQESGLAAERGWA